MAHYAFIDETSKVTEVITGVDETELIEGLDPEIWYGNFRGQVCKRTSFNTQGNVHNNGGTPFRYNYAKVGGIFDPTKGTDGAFIDPKTFDSWVLDSVSCTWVPPVAPPDDTNSYLWSEKDQRWVTPEEL
jgi:hypothetical protein